MFKLPMRRLSFIPFLLVFSFLNAQELKTYEYQRLRLGVEAGVESFFGKNVKPSAIRESQSYYFYDEFSYQYGFVYRDQDFTRYYFGVKPEYSLNHRFAVATGLRFSFGKSSLSADRDNFLWKVEESETSSNYARINGVSQNVYNIGIPLELKFFTAKSDLMVRQYFKVGGAFNFAFVQDISVAFANRNMEKYTSTVRNQFENPDFFNGQMVFAVGLKFGRMTNPFGSVEIQIPIQFSGKTRLNSLFKLEDNVGSALQATLYIPVGKKTLSYQYRSRR